MFGSNFNETDVTQRPPSTDLNDLKNDHSYTFSWNLFLQVNLYWNRWKVWVILSIINYGGYMHILRKRWPTLLNSFFHYLYLDENSSNCRYLKEASISTAMVPALGSIVEWKIFQSLFSRSKFSDGNISSDSSSITSTWSAFSGLSFKSSITRWFIKGYCQLVGCSLICWLGLLKFGLSEITQKFAQSSSYFGHLLSIRPEYEEDVFKLCLFLRKSKF